MKTSNLFKGELMTILISVWISALGIRVIFAKVTVVTQIFEWYGNSGLAHLGRVTEYCKNKKRKKNKHFDKKIRTNWWKQSYRIRNRTPNERSTFQMKL